MRSNEELDSIIGLLYEAVLDPSLWARFVERLADGLSAAQGTLVLLDERQPQNAIVRVVRFDPESEGEYLRRRHAEDVWWQRLPTAATGECFTGSELIDTEEFLATPLARDLGKRTDIAYMLGGWFEKSGHKLGVVSVLRGRSGEDFSTEDRAFLRRILPHLQRAMSLHQRFGAVLAQGRNFESALDLVSDAILLVGGDARVVFANSAAQRLLSAQCGLRVAAGRLMLEDIDAQRHLERAIRARERTEPNTCGYILARSTHTMSPMVIRTLPIAEPRVESFEASAPGLCAVMISAGGQAQPSPMLALLRSFYGLTPAEASVAVSLFCGKRLQEIAKLEGRSIHTVRAQLKACFARLGVRTQAELVRRLSTLCR